MLMMIDYTQSKKYIFVFKIEKMVLKNKKGL